MSDKLLTIQQAATRLGVATKTLRRWEARGVLIPQRTVGNQRRYTLEQIESFKRPTFGIQPTTVLTERTQLEGGEIALAHMVAPLHIASEGILKTQQAVPSPRLSNTKRENTYTPHILLQAAALLQPTQRYVLIGCVVLFLLLGAGSVGVRSGIVQSGLGLVLPSSTNRPASPSLGGTQAVSLTEAEKQAVLAETTVKEDLTFNVNIPAVFKKNALFDVATIGDVTIASSSGITTNNLDINTGTGAITGGTITASRIVAPNLITGLTAGSGISVTTGQSPTVANSGVLSLNDKTGAVTLTAGSGISISGTTITNSRSAFSGITLAGTSGSNQTLSDGDTLTIAAGNGITTTAASTDKVTVDLDVTTTSTTTTTTANSGLETSSTGLSLLRGCSDTQVLSWDATNVYWECASGGGISGSGTTGTLPKFSASTTLADSLISESSTTISLSTATALSASSLATITSSSSLALNGAATITTDQTTLTLFGTNATTVSFAGAATTLNLAGGSSSTGCTVDSLGNLTCTGNIAGGATGSVGYWTRSGTTVTPATATDTINTSGNITFSGTLNTNTFSSTALTFVGTDPVIAGPTGGSNTISLNSGASGSVLLAGGSGSNGCTIADATGNLTCTGSISSSGGSDTGYWSRNSGTSTVSPATTGDHISTTGNISSTGTGTITSAGLLTGQLGITITGATTSLNASSNFATNINTGTSTGTIGIGNSAAGAITMASGATSSFTVTNGNISLITASATGANGVINLTSALASGNTTTSAFNITTSTDLAGTDEVLQIGDSAGTFLTVRGDGGVGIGDISPDGLLDLDTAATSGTIFGITSTGIQTSGDIVNIAANSLTTADIIDISTTGLTTGSALRIAAGTAMTTGGALTIDSGTFVHTGAETGSLVSLTFTDTSTAVSGATVTHGLNIAMTDSAANNTAGSSTVNGINISSTINTSGATATKAIRGLNVAAPTKTGCSGGACTWTGINVAAPGTLANTTFYAATLGGNVGINTTTPTGLLHLNLNGSDTTPVFFDFSGDPGSSSFDAVTFDMASNIITGGNTGTWNILRLNPDDTSVSSGKTVTWNNILMDNGSGSPRTFATAGTGVGTWNGLAALMPNITQGGSTLTSNGIKLTTGTITTGGTQNAINISASGVGAGTLNGVLISTITGSSGTETGISIGGGWDDAINVNSGQFIVETTGVTSVGLDNTETTNGLCHSGADVDAASDTTVDIVACSAAPGDIAEWYETTGLIEEGEIVSTSNELFTYQETQTNPMTGEILPNKVTRTINKLEISQQPYQNNLIGIVSTSPYQVFGADIKTQGTAPKPIALTGRAPVKVSTENGPIAKGDYLTSSSTPGVAMKATRPGPVVGKALEDFSCHAGASAIASQDSIGTSSLQNDNVCQGKIMVFVNVSFADPQSIFANVSLDANGNLVSSSTYQVVSNNQTSPSDPLNTQYLIPNTTEASPSASLSPSPFTLESDPLFSSLQSTVNTLQQKIELLQASIISSASTSALLSNTASASAIMNSFQFPTPSAATGSATFVNTLDDLNVTNDTILNGKLNVLGRTVLSDLGVTGNISAGVLSIKGLDDCHPALDAGSTLDSGSESGMTNCKAGASINTLGGPLKLQSSGFESVEIAAGNVVIDKTGNIVVKGTVTAKEVKTDKLTITDSQASNSAVLSASAGTVEIKAGTTSIDIQTTALTDKSLVFTSSEQPIAIGAKIKDATTITVSLQTAQLQDTHVRWWIVDRN